MKKINDLRFWVVVASTAMFFLSIERAKAIPPKTAEIVSASVGGLPIDGVFAGIVVIGFITLLICVQQNLKNSNKNI